MVSSFGEKTNDRYVIFPIKHKGLWDLYKQAEASFWVAAEVDLSNDKFEELTCDEQKYISSILGFFACSDGVIMENLAACFLAEVQIAEARAFYSYQIFNEQIHSETYSTLIQTYIKDEAERNKLFQSIETMPTVHAKVEWAQKYMNTNTQSFAKRLCAFAVVEGLFFSASFCAIFWFKKRGLMPGLTFSNELISRDEGLHTRFACALLNQIPAKERPKDDEIVDIITSAVAIEETFVKEILPVELIGMNSKLMIEYVQFVANGLARQLGVSQTIYPTAKCPFPWMELISLEGKTNFFEKRVSEYKLSANYRKDGFSLSADF